jgi:hypothetical protein
MPGGAGPLAGMSPAEVDVPTAKELIEQVHQHVGVEELRTLVGELQVKAQTMRSLLRGPALDAAAVRAALEWTFVSRRKASAVLGARSDQQLADWVGELLDGTQPRGRRLERFCAETGGLSPAAAAELGCEFLHFSDPDRHGLWTRWIWSSDSRTGALALLIGEQYELDGGGIAETYERVCEAIAVLDASPEAAAFSLPGSGRLGTDLLLACAYGVYMRTVLGLKMTNEFNALVPPMVQLVRRLLGTHYHRQEVSA